MVKDHA
jgi:histone acetyltransferase